MFKYNPFRIVTDETPEGEANCNRVYNNALLSDGVKGLKCVNSRPPTNGERIDYETYCPYGSMLTWCEMYENGSANFYVREKLSGSVIGVLTIRPMPPYDAEKEYKTLDSLL
jgi:hypothetical protein